MKILYFAWVRQKVGKAEDELNLPAGVTTIAQLAEWLRSRGDGYRDALADPGLLRVARNREHASFDVSICNDDEIAFFPPVTGG